MAATSGYDPRLDPLVKVQSTSNIEEATRDIYSVTASILHYIKKVRIELPDENVADFSITAQMSQVLATRLRFTSKDQSLSTATVRTFLILLKQLSDSLNAYEKKWREIIEGDKMKRSLANSKLRRELEVLNATLHKDLSAMFDYLDKKVEVHESDKTAAEADHNEKPNNGNARKSNESPAEPTAETAPENKHIHQVKVHKVRSSIALAKKRVSPKKMIALEDSEEEEEHPLESETVENDENNIRAREPVLHLMSPVDSITLEEHKRDSDKFMHTLRYMINDKNGRAMWKRNFGLNTFMVSWDDFWNAFKSNFQREKKVYFIPAEFEVCLNNILDASSTGYVTMDRFTGFLESFGPLTDCINNVNNLFQEKWFIGFLSFVEAEYLVRVSEPGTFLIRFSSSRYDAFSLSVHLQTLEEEVLNVLITSKGARNFCLMSTEGEKVFLSLSDIVKYFSAKLRKPMQIKIPLGESYYCGEMTANEAAELLSNHLIGTYLLRFDTEEDCYALSCKRNTSVRHLLIDVTEEGLFVGDIETPFQSVPEIIHHFATIFEHPLRLGEQIGGKISTTKAIRRNLLSSSSGIGSRLSNNAVPSIDVSNLKDVHSTDQSHGKDETHQQIDHLVAPANDTYVPPVSPRVVQRETNQSSSTTPNTTHLSLTVPPSTIGQPSLSPRQVRRHGDDSPTESSGGLRTAVSPQRGLSPLRPSRAISPHREVSPKNTYEHRNSSPQEFEGSKQQENSLTVAVSPRQSREPLLACARRRPCGSDQTEPNNHGNAASNQNVVTPSEHPVLAPPSPLPPPRSALSRANRAKK